MKLPNKYLSFQLILACLIHSISSIAQSGYVTGTVWEFSESKSNLPLAGASVFWNNTTIGTVTTPDGNFSLELPSQLPAKLVISFVGFQSDTVEIKSAQKLTIRLKPSISLKAVTVEGRQDATQISTVKPINIEQVNQKELLKAACCNLSESFETNASVNVSYSDAITGAKEIQMLGLSGIYSQLMTESIPSLRGLAGTYGLSYVPGPWMESIQITKGSGSVANGFESTTGQINVEYLKPEVAEKFYLNGYVASTTNAEINAHRNLKVKEGVGTLLMFHGENMSSKWDHQNDGFLDKPLMNNVNVLNRWSVRDGKHFEGQFGVKGLYELRRGGQKGYSWGTEADTATGYGVRIETKRVELFSKTGLIFPETPWKSAGLMLSGTYHDQDSYFGLKTYKGNQKSLYGSLIYMSIIGTTDHKWKVGADLRHDIYEETYLLQPFDRTESVPGLYAEYTLNYKEKIGVVAGSRIDYHNEWGWFYTPRIHMKYNFTPDLIVRASAGKSFRTANVFADNIAIMATSRDLAIIEKLQPERAWNYGANFTAKFIAFYRPGSFSVDYYITDFTNQVIVDTYTSSDRILLYNLKGDSYSKSFQVALNYEAFKRFDVRLAYKNDDVFIDYFGQLIRKPLVPENRALFNLSYYSRRDIWRYDLTLQYQGEAKLSYLSPGQSHLPGHEETQVVGDKSPDFVTLNAQITRVMKQWEVYIGGENLTDYRQELTVHGYNDPFGPSFDATNIWGPVMGVKIYAGFRYRIK
jgi:outer membrane receptor for ferrienterochelin and colicins